jgi:hypothetical protein
MGYRRLKFKVDRKLLEHMHFSYFRPILEYADVIWDNCPNYIKEKLEHINYEAARIITGATKLTSIRIVLQDKLYENVHELD